MAEEIGGRAYGGVQPKRDRANRNHWNLRHEIIMIEFFKANPFLWNVNDKDHMNRTMRQAALKECIERLGGLDAAGTPFTTGSLKGKFSNMRSTFQREVRKVDESKNAGGDSDGETYTPKWTHWHRLMYLKEGSKDMSLSKSSALDDSTFQVEVNEVDNPETAQDDSDDSDANLNHQSNNGGSSNHQNNKRAASMSRKRINEDSDRTKRAKRLAEVLSVLRPWCKESRASTPERSATGKPEESAEDIFGKHIAASLKSMPTQYSREKAKLDIQNCIFQHMFNGELGH